MAWEDCLKILHNKTAVKIILYLTTTNRSMTMNKLMFEGGITNSYAVMGRAIKLLEEYELIRRKKHITNEGFKAYLIELTEKGLGFGIKLTEFLKDTSKIIGKNKK